MDAASAQRSVVCCLSSVVARRMILFTLAQAEALLPQIRDELLAMQALKAEIDELRVDLSHVVQKSAGNGHVKDEEGIGQKRQRAETRVAELNERLERLNA